MIFYKHYIGDYLRDTAHLTLLEHGIYLRLIHEYFLKENSLPLEKKIIFRLIRARTKTEKELTENILSEFFDETPEGFSHKRCDDEIAVYNSKKQSAKNNANARWNNANASSENHANASVSHTVRNASQKSESDKTILSNKSVLNTIIVEPTKTGKICLELTKLKIPPFNPTNPKFVALVESGATVEEFINTAIEIKNNNPAKFNFNYLLGTLVNRRREAKNLELHKGAMPAQTSREAGRQIAANSFFKSENFDNLTNEIEVQDAKEIT